MNFTVPEIILNTGYLDDLATWMTGYLDDWMTGYLDDWMLGYLDDRMTGYRLDDRMTG